MPLELLREIAKKNLPMEVNDPNDVDKLWVLRASSHVEVELPEPTSPIQKAKVLAITPKGWAVLKE